MATKKTAPFTLTERVTLTADNTDVFGVIDLASYVDVAARQGISIQSVDYIVQGATADVNLAASLAANSLTTCQLTDLNRGGLVFANDRALCSSMQLNASAQQAFDKASDVYPDNYGPHGSSVGRIVVNDSLYITGRCTNLAADVNITVRVTCTIVSLSAKDFMAIAIQSTAADN